MTTTIVSILVSIMAVCALFVTVTPVIDRLRDSKIRQQEQKIKKLINEVEMLKKEMQSQKDTLSNVQNELVSIFKIKE
jgi:uncharacterized membrane-anchored protein YhcB (DUF1043 family)